MSKSESWDKVNQSQTAVTDLLFKPVSEQLLIYFIKILNFMSLDACCP